MNADTIDSAEVAKFDAMAAAWWDPKGAAAPLHRLNPCRLDYIAEQIGAQFDRDRRDPAPFAGLSLIDVGCGGGLVAEPMARLGAAVTGLDASAPSVEAARVHAAQSGLAIDYRVGAAEALAAEAGGARFDVVLALEIVEHVADVDGFLRALRDLAAPGGLVILSTLNRTAESFLKAIVAAEHVLGWLPRGTHDWRRFMTPDALAAALIRAGLRPVDRMGMAFSPRDGQWRLDARRLGVNYLMAAERG